MSDDRNENWSECPRCGSPVLLDPQTSQPGPCANCAAQKSPWGLWTGISAMILGVLIFGLLLYVCLHFLFGVF